MIVLSSSRPVGCDGDSGLPKGRVASQDKAVLNNARQMAAAADQYYLENGANLCRDLPAWLALNYVKALNTVARRSYRSATRRVSHSHQGVANARRTRTRLSNAR